MEFTCIYTVHVEYPIDIYVLNHYTYEAAYRVTDGCKWGDKYWIHLKVRDVPAVENFLLDFKYGYLTKDLAKYTSSYTAMSKSDVYAALPSNAHGCVSYRMQKVRDIPPLLPESMSDLIHDKRFGCQWTRYNHREVTTETWPYGYNDDYETVKSANFSREDRYGHHCDMVIRLQLKTLPDDIGRFCAVRHLQLEGHALTDLPDSLSELRRLETLSLEDNEFTHFPNVLQKLHRLRELNVDLNPIPRTMSGLRKLQQLDLLKINIKSIGTDIKYMRELRVLKIGYGLPERQRTSAYTHLINANGKQMDEVYTTLPCELSIMPRLGNVHFENAATFSRRRWNDATMHVRMVVKQWLAGLVVLKILRRNVVKRRVDRVLYECAVHEFMMRERDRNGK